MPPSCAMAMAIGPSVTVSMAEDTSGTLSEMVRVNRVRVSAVLGRTSEKPGTTNTSSKVSASRIAAYEWVSGAMAVSLRREGGSRALAIRHRTRKRPTQVTRPRRCPASGESLWPPRTFPLESLRLAGGLACRTLAKARFIGSSSCRSEPPCSTLATNAPPGASVCRAKSNASSARATMRMWSVAVCPVVFGAMSDSTRSAAPPNSARRRAGMSGSMKSPSMNRAPVTGWTGSKSTPTMAPQPRFTATWLQPPGAAPRSRTRAPRWIRL